jgi:hypothetical protein
VQRVLIAGVAAVVAAIGIVGCGSGSDSAETSAPTLSITSSCDDWRNAAADDQRAFAEARNAARAVSFLETVNQACTPGRKALTIGEAVRIETAPPPDPYAKTRIDTTSRRYISREVRKSWNDCGPSDVCIPGEHAANVNCNQPDPQVRVLSCFVVTDKGTGGASDYGYTVKVNVSADGSFNWRLDR